jgi:hypothetical protein
MRSPEEGSSMTRHFPPHSQDAAMPASMLVDAMRCWRVARDAARPAQPHLADALAVHDSVILAPVLDSLFRFYEAALDRPIAVGAITLSADEHLLLDLLDGSRPHACIDGPGHAAHTLGCALCSTRIMLASE